MPKFRGVYKDARATRYFKASTHKDPLTGKWAQVTRRGFATAAEAAAAREDLLREVEAQPQATVSGLTVRQLVDQYLDECEATERLAEKSLFDYRHYLDDYIDPWIGSLRVGGLTAEVVASWQHKLASEGHRVLIATELIDDIARLDTTMKASKKQVAGAVTASGTTLTDLIGIGPIGAAIIIGFTGDVTRFPTKGHFATYNATAPIEASSGPRAKHRLNPGGNRTLNHAVHIAAITQLRYPSEGRAYNNRKIAEGRSSKDAIRSLKRKISDRVYRHLTKDARRAAGCERVGPGGHSGTTT